jgi:hypothetical protein
MEGLSGAASRASSRQPNQGAFSARSARSSIVEDRHNAVGRRGSSGGPVDESLRSRVEVIFFALLFVIFFFPMIGYIVMRRTLQRSPFCTPFARHSASRSVSFDHECVALRFKCLYGSRAYAHAAAKAARAAFCSDIGSDYCGNDMPLLS